MEKVNTKLLNFDSITLQAALEKIKAMSRSQGFDTVVTPNIDHMARILQAGVGSTIHQIYSNAALCLCDSRILEKMFRLKGLGRAEVITGSTLTQCLFETTIEPSDLVVVIGGNNKTIERLRDKYPKLLIQHYNPPIGFIERPCEVKKVIEFLSALDANYIFVGVGSPRQEILADYIRKDLDINGVALCVGASILFLVGEERRAPVWVQRLHCEWLFRGIIDPKLLINRYMKNFIYLPFIYRSL
jgi:N-acetylglucosaminyldiphosphoundecaprenol N-acetyl-beta-D-mannosaminyltransferase